MNTVQHRHYYTIGFKGLIGLAIVTGAAVQIAQLYFASK